MHDLLSLARLQALIYQALTSNTIAAKDGGRFKDAFTREFLRHGACQEGNDFSQEQKKEISVVCSNCKMKKYLWHPLSRGGLCRLTFNW